MMAWTRVPNMHRRSFVRKHMHGLPLVFSEHRYIYLAAQTVHPRRSLSFLDDAPPSIVCRHESIRLLYRPFARMEIARRLHRHVQDPW
jgi:hypothetical protein